MPTDDVSDLRDVVDAINKLCANMKTSYDYDDQETDANPTEADEAPVDTESIPEEPEVTQAVDQMEDAVDTWSEPALPADVAAEMYYSAIAEASLDMWNDSISEMSQPEPTRTYGAVYNPPCDGKPKTERFAEHAPAQGGPCPAEIETGPPKVATELKSAPPKEPTEIESSPPLDPVEVETDHPKGPSSEQTETHSVTSEERRADKYETEAAAYETTSEMYYTASSEVSLLSDTDLMEKVTEGQDESDKEKSDRNIMAGHVAAMRERFESMTRANTPCPDLGRAASPSLDMFRNITPSPDFLDKS